MQKLFPKYAGSITAALEREEASSGKKGVCDVADFRLSAAASVVEGLGVFATNQVELDERWMWAYKMLLRKREGKVASEKGK